MLLSHRAIEQNAAYNVITLDQHPLTLDRRELRTSPACDRPNGCVTDKRPEPRPAPSSAQQADVIDFQGRMICCASIEIDDLPWIRGHFSLRVRHQIISSVRKLLCREFGRHMVARDQLLFSVQHRNVNTLIAGLLRVQFYANQIVLPEFNVFGDRVEQNGVTITWGVGRSVDEAQHERIKKRKRRNLRRR